MTNIRPSMLGAAENKRTGMSGIRRRVALPEALAFSVFVLAYIWRLQSSSFNSWMVFPVWFILSFAFHGDTPKTLGWRADNLWPATRQTALPLAVFIAVIFTAGLLLGALHRAPIPLMQPRHLIRYFAFCLLQEVGLQSFLMNRLLTTLEKPLPSAVVSGAIFAAMHWPNPVLVPLTFIGAQRCAGSLRAKETSFRWPSARQFWGLLSGGLFRWLGITECASARATTHFSHARTNGPCSLSHYRLRWP